MLEGMRRVSLYHHVLLAAILAISGVRLAAQDSLGDVARRIRASRGEDPSSPADKTSATPRTAPTTADLNAITILMGVKDEAAFGTRVRTQLEQENFLVLDSVAAAESAEQDFPAAAGSFIRFTPRLKRPR